MSKWRKTALERFWEKVQPEPNSGCWLWAARLTSSGYGQFGRSGSPGSAQAHRWAYEHFRGPIPHGLQIDHLCRVRSCVNPDHLEPVTCRENVLRADGVTSRNARKTACKRGHPLVPGNIRWSKKGRYCRQCDRLRSRAFAAAQDDPEVSR